MLEKDRLPSVSAAQALRDLENGASRPVATGLDALDKALACDPFGDNFSADSAAPGGVQRGQLTEVWGPPGSGKTSLG